MLIKTKKFLAQFLLAINLLSYNSFLTSSSFGYWQQSKEADFSISISRDYKINKDGSHTLITDSYKKILNENAKKNLTNTNLQYNTSVAKIKVLEFEIIRDGKKINLQNDDNVEDKPIHSRENFYDQTNQLRLTAPNLQIGDILHIKTEGICKQQTIPNHFQASFELFAQPMLIEKDLITFTSEMPLKSFINNPDNLYKFSDSIVKNPEFTSGTVEFINKPIVYNTLDESGILNDKISTCFAFSSGENWTHFAKKLAPKYYEVINQKLPEILNPMLLEAEKIQNSNDKLEFVLEKIINNMVYMGDLRPVNGFMFPRNLEQIVKSGLGDCKDFSVLTGAILKNLGYKVYPAFVYRNFVKDYQNFGDLAFYAMNHTFLKIIDKDGTVFWIDPTNYVASAKNIFGDIADKEVLVLDEELIKNNSLKLEHTPAMDYEKNGMIVNRNVEIIDNDIKTDGTIKLLGANAIYVTGSELFTSKEQIENSLFNELSLNLQKQDRIFLELPELKSRIVKDLDAKFSFIERDAIAKTNLGDAINLGKLNIIRDIKLDQVSDFILSNYPNTTIGKKCFKNINIKTPEILEFHEDNEYFTVTRKIENIKNDCFITVKVVHKKTIIPASEIQTEKFKAMKKRMQALDSMTAIIEKVATSKDILNKVDENKPKK